MTATAASAANGDPLAAGMSNNVATLQTGLSVNGTSVSIVFPIRSPQAVLRNLRAVRNGNVRTFDPEESCQIREQPEVVKRLHGRHSYRLARGDVWLPAS